MNFPNAVDFARAVSRQVNAGPAMKISSTRSVNRKRLIVSSLYQTSMNSRDKACP